MLATDEDSDPVPKPSTTLATILTRARRQAIFTGLTDTLWVAAVCIGLAMVTARWSGLDPLGPTVTAGVVAVALAWRRPPSLTTLAARLDARHGLADLLGSAWATRDRSNEPWAAALAAQADAVATRLPSAGRSARFTFRHHASVWAASAALWLAAGLVPGRAGPSFTRVAADAARPADAQRLTADAGRRAPETADEAGRLPMPTEIAPTPGRSARRAGDAGDARGTGRADAGRPGRLATAAAATARPAATGAAGGGGPAAPGDGGTDPGGTVLPPPPAEAGPRPSAASAASPDGRTMTAADGGAEYRAIVHDFFLK